MPAVAESTRAFVVWWRDLDRWVNPHRTLQLEHLPKGWKLVRVGDVVRQLTMPVALRPDHEYRLVGVKWYGQGTFLRETLQGREIGASRLFPLVAGSFIYNRLFAWKASFAVVPKEHEGCFVSGEFPQFAVDASCLLPEFLYHYFTTERVISNVQAASVGSAAVSRNRFKEDIFLQTPLPLPPLSVQRDIVNRWRRAQKIIEASGHKLAELDDEIEANILADLSLVRPKRGAPPKILAVLWKQLDRWSVMFNQLASINVDIGTGKYPATTLGDVAAVSYGIQKSPENRPGLHARPYLRVANVQRGALDLREIKTINVSDAEMPGLRLEPEDLLVCEGNSADLVGRPAIWHDEIPDCVHQNHILKVRTDRSKVLPEYVLEYMQTRPARIHFRSRAKFTTNLASINSNDLREMPLPLPPLNTQRVIAERIAKQRSRIAVLKERIRQGAQQAKADVEAMILGQDAKKDIAALGRPAR